MKLYIMKKNALDTLKKDMKNYTVTITLKKIMNG